MKIALIIVVVAVAALVIVIALQPADFRIERSATIAAPPAAVFAQVNDFRNWRNWSPWENIDPQLKRTYEGAPAGQGAVYAWTGDKNVGEGRMTIIDSQPSERLRIKLEFMKPMSATNDTLFAFKPAAGGTQVTWTMTGTNSFIAKAFALFMNMERMVGGMFEQGLAQLKAVAEKK